MIWHGAAPVLLAPQTPAALVLLAATALATQAAAQALTRPKVAPIEAHVVVTAPEPATAAAIASLKLPAGFRIAKWAEGLDTPRVIAVGNVAAEDARSQKLDLTNPTDVAVAPNGDVYVSSNQAGTVTLLRGGETAGARREVLKKKDVQGLAVHEGRLFYTTIHEIYSAPIAADGSLGAETLVADRLPDVGQHNDRTIAFGPDGWLYASIGSTCNECEEKNPESATLVRMHADGSGREVFATGLRNTIGFGWREGALYGWDDGVDWLGDDAQREEFNRIEQGKKYGWPYVLGDGQLNLYRDPPRGQGSVQDWDKASVRPVLTYTAHSSGMQMVVYAGTAFPAEYRGDAFATLHGSWNRRPPSGYEIVRIHFEGGKPAKIEPFLTGFLKQTGPQSWSRFARPFGLAQARDGSLLMGEDQNGVIYRISYAK